MINPPSSHGAPYVIPETPLRDLASFAPSPAEPRKPPSGPALFAVRVSAVPDRSPRRAKGAADPRHGVNLVSSERNVILWLIDPGRASGACASNVH